MECKIEIVKPPPNTLLVRYDLANLSNLPRAGLDLLGACRRLMASEWQISVRETALCDKLVTALGAVASDEPLFEFYDKRYGDGIAAPVCAQVAVFSESENKLVSKLLCGTSMAAPLVANVALRVFARRPNMSPAAVKELLMATCDSSGLDVACGGRLDLDAAAVAVAQGPTESL